MATQFTAAPENVQALFGDAQTQAKAHVEKGTKIIEEMSSFAKGNVEAIVASGRVAAKGVETMSQDVADYGRKHLEGASAAFKSFVAAKSPAELLQLQSDFARASFDAAVADGSKLAESMMKLVGEIMQPLSSRMAIAAEKIKSPLA